MLQKHSYRDYHIDGLPFTPIVVPQTTNDLDMNESLYKLAQSLKNNYLLIFRYKNNDTNECNFNKTNKIPYTFHQATMLSGYVAIPYIKALQS